MKLILDTENSHPTTITVKGKEITLHHNGYEISIKIEEDYEETIEKIKEKLYFTDKDMEKYQLFYYDEDNDECDYDKGSYKEAYSNEEITEFGLRQKEEINKIWTEKCREYKKKIKTLEGIIKNLKKMQKASIDDLKKIQETSIENTIKEVISAAEQKIGEICEQCNNELYSTLKTNLAQSLIQINTECNNIKKGIESLNTKQDNLDKIFNDTKDYVSELYKRTTNINGRKKINNDIIKK